MIFLVTGCNGNDTRSKALVVGLDADYAPMGFRDEKGNIVGFDIDLAKEVARRMNICFEFKPINWNNKREEITSGNVDMIWNGTDISDERKEYMIFTKPYMKNRQILLVKSDRNLDIHSEYDFGDKIVGLQSGSTSEDYVNENKALQKESTIFKTYPNFVEAFEALDNGNIDVLICDELAARYEINKHQGKFRAIEVTVGHVTEIAIGFKKENVELRDKIQKVFDEMVADGTARKISLKWFDADLLEVRRK